MSSERLKLAALQSNMKVDPEGYRSEVSLLYNQFKSSLELFRLQAALSFTSITGVAADKSVVKDLGDLTMLLAHVTSFFPKELSRFPTELLHFLKSSAPNLMSGLRLGLTKALILLRNRKMIDIAEALVLFMELQTLGDEALRQLAHSHVVQSIRRMNQKHKNYPKNKALQNILFGMLREEDEAKAKQSLITLCDLQRRKVWCDESTSNAICMACLHPSSRVMAAALSILLDFDKIKDDDTDDSDSEDGQATLHPLIVLNKEALYKASHKGTTSSQKKKKLKLRCIARSMKKQQRLSSGESNSNYCSPLIHLKDAQGFAEKLLYRLESCKEKIEVKMKMIRVIARIVGLYHLILLNFYTYLERYIELRYMTTVLAAVVQACHEMVPPDAVAPLLRKIVIELVNKKSMPEDIAVGVNVVREICLRMPLLMTDDLLQDLVMYKKSKKEAVSSAARSLCSLYREICPSLLAKKDRGRPAKVPPKLKAFGEVHVATNVPFAELLEHGNQGSSEEDIDGKTCDLSAADDDQEDDSVHLVEEDVSGEDDEVSDVDVDEINTSADGATEICDEEESDGNDDDDDEYGDPDLWQTDDEVSDVDEMNCSADGATEICDEEESDGNDDDEYGDPNLGQTDDEVSDVDEMNCSADGATEICDEEESDGDDDDEYGDPNLWQTDDEVSDVDEMNCSADGATEICEKEESEENADDEELETNGSIGIDADTDSNISREKKRKFSDLEGQLNVADTSRPVLMKVAGTTGTSSSTYDGIFSNEDFQRIKELKAEKEARTALLRHGLKLRSADQLSMKRVDAATLESNIKRKLTKEQKLALIREVREEERGKYQARTAIKKKKTGGSSNREKEHKKLMPSAARKAKIGRTRQEKKIKKQRSSKQFRGRKAWK